MNTNEKCSHKYLSMYSLIKKQLPLFSRIFHSNLHFSSLLLLRTILADYFCFRNTRSNRTGEYVL